MNGLPSGSHSRLGSSTLSSRVAIMSFAVVPASYVIFLRGEEVLLQLR